MRPCIRKLGSVLAPLAVFASAATGYSLLWSVIGPDALDGFGYQLWLRGTPDDVALMAASYGMRYAFVYVMPVLVALVSARWFLVRRAHRVGRRTR